MPDISSTEQLAWQRQACTLLGRLLELAAKDGLPVIRWTVGTGRELTGEFYAHPHSVRRRQFAAWKTALAQAADAGPDSDYEHTLGFGETRLVANWRRIPVREGQRDPTVNVTITASVWADDEDQEG